MTNFMSNNRWYDRDATVSLAVSVLRNASIQDQLLVAELIIQKAQNHNISLDKSSNGIIKLFSRRWYDEDDKLCQAMEYLRLASSKLQKELAIEIINCLCNADYSGIQE